MPRGRRGARRGRAEMAAEATRKGHHAGFLAACLGAPRKRAQKQKVSSWAGPQLHGTGSRQEHRTCGVQGRALC